MRAIHQIIIHYSETPDLTDIGVREIDKWHKDRGWSQIGYHYVIRLDGTIEVGRSVNLMGAHCHGQNRDSIGICYVGGVRDGVKCDTRTQSQKNAITKLIAMCRHMHQDTHLLVFGHNDYSDKLCPGFDAKLEYN